MTQPSSTSDGGVPEGIQAFGWITLAVFERLYDAFPEKVDFRGIRFVLETVIAHGPDSNEATWSKYHTASISWLEREGFVVIDGHNVNGDFLGVSLTLKGFTALGYAREPRKWGWRTPMIKSVKVLTKAGVTAASSKAAEVLLGKIFALFSGL